MAKKSEREEEEDQSPLSSEEMNAVMDGKYLYMGKTQKQGRGGVLRIWDKRWPYFRRIRKQLAKSMYLRAHFTTDDDFEDLENSEDDQDEDGEPAPKRPRHAAAAAEDEEEQQALQGLDVSAEELMMQACRGRCRNRLSLARLLKNPQDPAAL